MSHLPDPKDMADLFQRLAAREAAAFGEIATRLRDRLRWTARRRLKREPELSAIYEESDAIQSGLGHMWKGILAGTMAPPDGVDSFLRGACMIIVRRIGARARAERAAKRDPTPNRERDQASRTLHGPVPDDLDLLESRLMGPEAERIAHEELQWLLSLIDPVVRDIAEGRLRGLTVAEIALKRGRSTRTIERVLGEVLKIWLKALRDRDA